jgi:hypothetical protein
VWNVRFVSAGPLRLQNVLNAKSVMKSYAASGGCLLMYSTEKDQLIPYERQLELFAEFNRTATCRKSFLETNEYQGKFDDQADNV